MKALKIGGVTLENPLVLAPMAGVTDLPFRLLCKEQGAGLLCMEMVSAKAILYKNRNTAELLQIDGREHPVSLQLFGDDPGHDQVDQDGPQPHQGQDPAVADHDHQVKDHHDGVQHQGGEGVDQAARDGGVGTLPLLDVPRHALGEEFHV